MYYAHLTTSDSGLPKNYTMHHQQHIPDPISSSQQYMSTQSNINHMVHRKTIITEARHDNYTSAFSDGELVRPPHRSDATSPNRPSTELGTLKNKAYCVWI